MTSMSKRLAPLTSEEYIERDAEVCPFCRADGIKAERPKVLDATTVYIVCMCDSCPETWAEYYSLTEYQR